MFKSLNQVTFDDLVAGIALYRPGPLMHIPDYVARANGYTEVTYPCPELEVVLKKTHGIAVYQESIMAMSRVMAGYTKSETTKLRKAISKKKEEVMRPALDELFSRVIMNGHSEELAKKIIDIIEPFVGYAFNKSHSVAYAIVCFMTAYFKTYYPLEFMAALLTVFGTDVKKVVPYVAECKRMGFEVLPPDVNKSEQGFTIEGTNLRFGLRSLKGVGEIALDRIVEDRPFEDLADIIKRVPKKFLNKRVVDNLSLAGAFDSLCDEKNRMQIVADAYKLRGEKKINLTEIIADFDQKAKLDHEKAILGVFISGHPLDGYAKPVGLWPDKSDGDRFETAGVICEFNEIKTKRGEFMAFVTLDTIEGIQNIVIFPREYESIKGQLVEDLILKLSIQIEFNVMRNERNYIAKRVTIPKKVNRGLYIAKPAPENPDEIQEYEYIG